MFVVKQSDSYEWTVSVDFPVSGDKFKTQTFTAEFKRISQGRIKEIISDIKTDKITDGDLIREVVIGWKGVTDESGNDFEFSEAALDKLLDIQLVSAAIAKSFFASISGAKTKN